MATALTSALISVAIGTLRDLLVDEVKFLYGVSDQVKQVERDLKTMHSLLMDADKWSGRHDPASLDDWITNLKGLAFEAENVLEKYAVEVTSRREGRDLKEKLKRFICILCECCGVHHLGKEIKGITSGLTNLTDRLKSMSGRDGSSNSVDELQRGSRLTFGVEDEEVKEHFVGMETDIQSLVSMMKDDGKRSNRVISIYGMGGLGKTTLARKIYNDKELGGCFGGLAWVCVTQQFQAEAVLREVLKQLPLKKDQMDRVDTMGQTELVRQIQNVLNQTKCLFVIDDIWESDHWDTLKTAFPTNCKVLLTTRNEYILPEECVYKLDFLTEDQGWELLQKIALAKDRQTPVLEHELNSLKDIGKEMVRKCGRLPLAISVIGGTLRHKQTLAEWKEVNSNIDRYLIHREGLGENKRVKRVLDLSFDVLPYYLKPCFLYLGCFGEDEEIETERLYMLWMAEGLIPSEEKRRGETLIDVAERYLTELALRCMVQVQKDEIWTPHNKFKSCRLHDLMHNLCSSKAEEQKFLKRIDIRISPFDVPPIGASLSRLAVCVDRDGNDVSINKIQNIEDLRSLLVFKKRGDTYVEIIRFQSKVFSFEKSRYLKILMLDHCAFEDCSVPSEVGGLVHLRYLNLSKSSVAELPLFVCKLPYLQILYLDTSSTIKLPNAICKMKRLRHLFLGKINVIGGDKLKLDGLNELETLDCYDTEMICFADIPKLTNLRLLSIDIKDLDSLSIIVHHMSENQSQLRKTSLRVWDCDFSAKEGTNILSKMLMSRSLVSLILGDCEISCGFPCYQQGMCENLVSLGLKSSNIGGDATGIVGNFPLLKYLWLESIYMNAEMICRANSFPQLKMLDLDRAINLKKWVVEERAMINLSDLLINRCMWLEMIPDGLRSISTLRKLKCTMPRKFNNRLKVVNGQEGEDYYKVRHIPSIQLYKLVGRYTSGDVPM